MNWMTRATLMLLGGLIMIVIGMSLSMESIAEMPLDYWMLNSLKIESVLCGGLFFLLALHYLNCGKIQDLYEEIEKLKENNEGGHERMRSNILVPGTCILGVMMIVLSFIIMHDQGGLSDSSFEYWRLEILKIGALLCSSIFFILNMHYRSLDMIIDLEERMEKLEGKNEGDMSE